MFLLHLQENQNFKSALMCFVRQKLDVRASHPTRFINGLCC